MVRGRDGSVPLDGLVWVRRVHWVAPSRLSAKKQKQRSRGGDGGPRQMLRAPHLSAGLLPPNECEWPGPDAAQQPGCTAAQLRKVNRTGPVPGFFHRGHHPSLACRRLRNPGTWTAANPNRKPLRRPDFWPHHTVHGTPSAQKHQTQTLRSGPDRTVNRGAGHDQTTTPGIETAPRH